MLRKTLMLMMTFGLSSTLLFAQFSDSTNYYIQYQSAGIFNKTNQGKSFVLNNALKFNIYKNKYELSTFNNWIYGQQLDKLSNNDFHSVIDFSLFKSQRHIYFWALTNFEKSYSLKTNHRLQSGAGIGYYVIDRGNFVIQVSDGLLVEKSDLYDTERSANDYTTVRNSFRVKFRIIANNILTLESSDFIQHSVEDGNDYIIKSTSTIALKLKKWLAFTVAVNYNKLNLTGRENLLINLGFNVEKYY